MDASWWTPIDAYCERCSPDFWAEPYNALSNLAFLIAAAFAAKRAAATPGSRGTAGFVLAGLLAIIGIGSFLFHTFANRWSLLADIIPIGVFILVYFVLSMRVYFGLRWPAAVLAMIAYQATAFGAGAAWRSLVRSRGFDPLNGSFDYLPAGLAMLTIGSLVLSQPSNAGAGARILSAAAIFALSLTFRSIDLTVCATLPIGTHFLWHGCNALLLYVLCDALMRYPRSAAANA